MSKTVLFQIIQFSICTQFSFIWPIAGNFLFINLGTLNRPDLYFEGAGNGPVVITWIGRDNELYSGASPISLVEHCVTSRHDRRLLSLLGFVHNWPTSRWSATKKENRLSLNGNGIMSFFLGRQFYRSTLYLFVSTQPFTINRMWHKVNFSVEYSCSLRPVQSSLIARPKTKKLNPHYGLYLAGKRKDRFVGSE